MAIIPGSMMPESLSNKIVLDSYKPPDIIPMKKEKETNV
jgi:hypothetical protein